MFLYKQATLHISRGIWQIRYRQTTLDINPGYIDYKITLDINLGPTQNRLYQVETQKNITG